MSDKNLKYQEAMDRLEVILEKIDSSEIGIDDLSEKVIEASGLLKTCKQILTKTEKNVQESLQTLSEEFDDQEKQGE